MTTSTKNRTARYTVRVPGCTAWSTHRTLAAAEREASKANRACRPGHEVYCEYDYATDSETGTITARDFAEACRKLDKMVTPEAIHDGGWGWVEDINGQRYTAGK